MGTMLIKKKIPNPKDQIIIITYSLYQGEKTNRHIVPMFPIHYNRMGTDANTSEWEG